MLYPIELWVQPLICRHFRPALTSRLDNLILNLRYCPTEAQKSSAEHRQALAENSVFKSHPLHAIWDILCQIAGQWQVEILLKNPPFLEMSEDV